MSSITISIISITITIT